MKKQDSRNQVDWNQFDIGISLAENKRHAAGSVWAYSLAVKSTHTNHQIRSSRAGGRFRSNQANEETLLAVALSAALNTITPRERDAIKRWHGKAKPRVIAFTTHQGFVDGIKSGNVNALGSVKQHLSKVLSKFDVSVELDPNKFGSRCREIERWATAQFRPMATTDEDWLPVALQPAVVSALG